MKYNKISSVLIKRYPSRRLYNTETSCYTTLNDLLQLVKTGQNFHVIDIKTNEDITRNILIQIIFEQEAKGYNSLPIEFLKSIIYYSGNQELFNKFVIENPLSKMLESFRKNNIDLIENSFNMLYKTFNKDK